MGEDIPNLLIDKLNDHFHSILSAGRFIGAKIFADFPGNISKQSCEQHTEQENVNMEHAKVNDFDLFTVFYTNAPVS